MLCHRLRSGGHGRRKIEIEYIKDKIRRHITFSKRKAGISKKAYELSRLTGAQVRSAAREASTPLSAAANFHGSRLRHLWPENARDASQCIMAAAAPRPAPARQHEAPLSPLTISLGRPGAAAHLERARADLLLCDAEAAADPDQR
jgi:hypothetical protein